MRQRRAMARSFLFAIAGSSLLFLPQATEALERPLRSTCSPDCWSDPRAVLQAAQPISLDDSAPLFYVVRHLLWLDLFLRYLFR